MDLKMILVILEASILHQKPESWKVTVLQPQSLEKKDDHHKSSKAHIPGLWSLP